MSTKPGQVQATAWSTAIGRIEDPSHCANQKKIAMHARLQPMANATGNCGVVASIRPEAAMVYLNGSKQSFRCHCGCNIFTTLPKSQYKCNGCRELYQGS